MVCHGCLDLKRTRTGRVHQRCASILERPGKVREHRAEMRAGLRGLQTVGRLSLTSMTVSLTDFPLCMAEVTQKANSPGGGLEAVPHAVPLCLGSRQAQSCQHPVPLPSRSRGLEGKQGHSTASVKTPGIWAWSKTTTDAPPGPPSSPVAGRTVRPLLSIHRPHLLRAAASTVWVLPMPPGCCVVLKRVMPQSRCH